VARNSSGHRPRWPLHEARVLSDPIQILRQSIDLIIELATRERSELDDKDLPPRRKLRYAHGTSATGFQMATEARDLIIYRRDRHHLHTQLRSNIGEQCKPTSGRFDKDRARPPSTDDAADFVAEIAIRTAVAPLVEQQIRPSCDAQACTT
jgi:hypothetical protein